MLPVILHGAVPGMDGKIGKSDKTNIVPLLRSLADVVFGLPCDILSVLETP
jgi:hypothetical protein